jgi:hypothetical protein
MTLQSLGTAPSQSEHPAISVAPAPAARLAAAIETLIADIGRAYAEAQDFRWHVAGAHLRRRRLLRDDRGNPVLASLDITVEPVHRRGGRRVRSVAHVLRLDRLASPCRAGEIVAAGLLEIWDDRPETAGLHP